MGFNTVGTGKLDPKTIYGIQHSWDRETGPKDHIWDSTQLGQGNWTQRPYMGFNTVAWDSKTGPKDHIWDPKTIYGIQHSWDRKTGPKDHNMGFNTVGTGKLDPKTIYGIQRSGTGKLDPKTIGFHTVGTGKPDPKTIYGTQRPYFNYIP